VYNYDSLAPCEINNNFSLFTLVCFFEPIHLNLSRHFEDSVFIYVCFVSMKTHMSQRPASVCPLRPIPSRHFGKKEKRLGCKVSFVEAHLHR